MPSQEPVFDKLQQIMTDALLNMQSLTASGALENPNFVTMAKVFLLGIISTAADLAEVTTPGAATYLYSEIEAGAKQGGLRFIKEFQKSGGASYSLSGIADDDVPSAMNYVGQELSATLFKTIHELPKPLRTPEMLLRGIELLLANLLNQKFNNSHDILNSLCEHVHMALDDLQSRDKVTNKKISNVTSIETFLKKPEK